MATVARPRERVIERVRSIDLDARWVVPVGLAALTLLALYLRTRRMDAPLWIDEGLSVGIAEHGFFDIPGVLRQDGSPPLYYMLLSLWVDAFGTGDEALRWLSLVFGLAIVPVAFWAGDSLFGRRAAWLCALLAAIFPFVTRHAQEARMYGLMSFLSLVAVAAFAQAFVRRRRRYVPVFGVVLAVMLYTHNWAFFFAAASVGALAWLAYETDDRRGLLRDGALAYGGAALLYLPWVPTLLFQAQHTGAPWAETPGLKSAQRLIVAMLGGYGPATALLIGAGAGIAAAFALPQVRERRVLKATFAIGGGALLLAWLVSQASPAWADRYFAIFVGPLLVLGAAGLSRAGRLGLACALLLFLFWAQPREYSSPNISERNIVGQVAPRLERGDLVIVTHPERTPVVEHYMPEGMRYATLTGPVADPKVMDWRDVLDRTRRARTRQTLPPLLDRVAPGSRVVIVRPLIRTNVGWGSTWTKLVRRRSSQWAALLAQDPRFERVVDAPRPLATVLGGVRAEVYRKKAN